VDDALELDGLEQLPELLEIGLLERGPEIHEIDGAGHFLFLPFQGISQSA
jgi:hypothetical protein